MKKTQKKLSKQKILITITLLVFLFSIIKVGTTLASTEPFSITSAEVSAKSSTVDVGSFSFERCKITNNVTFHQVGDSITYKIKVKNNEDTSYTIKSVSDDNENKYISYIYDSYEGTKLNSKEETTFEITEKYVQEIGNMSKRNQSFSVNIIFTLEDEQGNVIETTIPINASSNPKTGDNVGIYGTLATLSLIMLIILSRKNAKRTSNNKDEYYGKHSKKGFKFLSLLIVGTLILPTISKAATNYSLALTVENNIALKDKLIVSYKIDDEKYELTTKYNELITGLENPEKEGYDFEGWLLEDGTVFDIGTAKITDGIT